jgi:cytochrome c2
MRRARLMSVILGCLALAGCDYFLTPPLQNKYVQDGDAARGLALMAGGTYGCAACHAIPGIRAPKGVVGPPLAGMARRGFIAGQLPNKPGVMVAFLQNPPALLPQTGMPNVGLTSEEARHMAAYLYTLELPDAQ